MSDDLTAPLGLSPRRRRGLPSLPLGLMGLTLVIGVIAGGLFWVAIVDDPYGGEPIAQVSLDRVREGVVDARDIKVAPGSNTSGPASLSPMGAGDARLSAIDPSKIARGAPEGAALLVGGEPALQDASPHGPIPKIGPDGARPMDVYARAARPPTPGLSRVVVVVGGLGMSQTGTDIALKGLPSAVTLAFSPYGSNLDRWVARARAQGHELLIQVPLEPFDYPDNDPGPHTLMTSLTPEANIDRLHWALSRIPSFVGVVNHMGARFTAAPENMTPVLAELGKRGLMYLDDGSSVRTVAPDVAKTTGAPFAKVDVVIDAEANEEQIEARLLQLEGLARQRGLAIGIATALPVSIRRITEWSKTLEARGVVIVPASAAGRGE